MKLIDILARKLAEWPERAEGITQSHKGNLYYFEGPRCNRTENVVSLSGDHRQACITRPEWQAARAAYLESQEPNFYEWREWSGGECPVDDDSLLVDVKFACGVESQGKEAYKWNWSASNRGGNITAWRPHREEGKQDAWDEAQALTEEEYHEKPYPNLSDWSEVQARDHRELSAQEYAYVVNQIVKTLAKDDANKAEKDRYKQHCANVLTMSDPHAQQLGLSQFRGGY